MTLNLKIAKALEMLKNKEISCVELTKSYIDNAKSKNKELNAYTVITEDIAMEQARKSDALYSIGEARSLEGIPIGVKDLFCTNGVESSSCSKLLKGFVPKYESTVTTKLFDSGAVMTGKTNMDEFAMGSANDKSARGDVVNPWKRKGSDAKIVPGGSSGGSSAAVAANMCMAALGSDTGGSIRQPASFTGTVGIKPTYGRCSRFGMISFASSLDQAGVIAKDVLDSALVLEAICGHDKKDSTSSRIAVPSFTKNINAGVKGMRIGIPKEYRIDGMPDEIINLWAKAANWLKEQGAEIVDISLPHTKYALPTYYIIAPAEASSNLARFDGVRYGNRAEDVANINDMYEKTRSEGFGEEVKRRIMIGTYVLSAGYYDAYFTKAQKIRNLILRDFTEAFAKVDAILTPTTPSEAFALGELNDDPIKMYINDVLTVPASLAGLPCISVPGALTNNNLPLGLQLITNHFEEVNLFKAAKALEDAAGFKPL